MHPIKHVNNYLLFIIILFWFIAGCSENKSTIDIETQFDRLTFLEGTWRGQDGDNYFYENWQKQSDTSLNGMGYGLEGIDTTFSETLRILKTSGKIFYVALVAHNQGGVAFQLIEADSSTYVFENKNHDFPNIIKYHLLDNDSLEVSVIGQQDEEEVEIIYHFEHLVNIDSI